MPKMIKKDKLTFRNGYLCKKNKVIGLPREVWLQLNQLEVTAQQYLYLKDQDPYCAGPTLDGFERKTSIGFDCQVKAKETPVTDKRVEEAMKFIEEQEMISDAETINERLKRYKPLIDWCESPEFVAGDCFDVIDTPTLGNPLTLRAEDITNIFCAIVDDPVVMSPEV